MSSSRSSAPSRKAVDVDVDVATAAACFRGSGGRWDTAVIPPKLILRGLDGISTAARSTPWVAVFDDMLVFWNERRSGGRSDTAVIPPNLIVRRLAGPSPYPDPPTAVVALDDEDSSLVGCDNRLGDLTGILGGIFSLITTMGGGVKSSGPDASMM